LQLVAILDKSVDRDLALDNAVFSAEDSVLTKAGI